MRIHVFGGAGTGTTTLGKTLGEALSFRHLDCDDFYWRKSDVPYTREETPERRIEEIRRATDGVDRWILSGSMASWGDALIPEFTHMIYLTADWETRRERLLKRELARFGAEALEPGGIMHQVHRDFMGWAGRYDDAGLEQRSRTTHEAWIAGLPARIRVSRLDGGLSRCELLASALRQLESSKRSTRTDA